MMPAERVIYVVDDDPAIRRSLERLLDAADFRVMSYATPKEFLDVAGSLRVGCVLLDLHMMGMNGLEVQARLLQLNAELPVILMTGHGDIRSVVRAMKAGASDFIEKPYGDDALIAAIEAALKRVAQHVRSDEIVNAVALIDMLSPRERQVLEALVDGNSNKAIAFELGISIRTIEVHRARMMDRLGVRQLAEAVRLAVLARLTGDS